MRKIVLALVLVGGVGVFASVASAGCNDPDLNSVRDQILATCSTEDQSQGRKGCNGNHGNFVSCVAHAVNDATRGDDPILDRNCKGKVVRCAARSTCGKPEGFVTCAQCEPGPCVEGFCEDGVTACSETVPCPLVVTRCSIKSSADHCTSQGGISGTGSCCQADCTPD
jgi:hypothetical protein